MARRPTRPFQGTPASGSGSALVAFGQGSSGLGLMRRAAAPEGRNVGRRARVGMILKAIETAWSWTGLEPEAVLRTSSFGNIIVRAVRGRIWRICPEELSCTVVAESEAEFFQLEDDPEFESNWRMNSLVETAEQELGPLSEGRCYCLKIPAVFGGAYDVTNLGTNTLVELIAFAGHVAEQIKDVPDGARVKLVVTE